MRHDADRALDRRRDAALWASLSPRRGRGPAERRALNACSSACAREGASFFDELAEAARCLRPQVEEALGELVALGLVTSDSFGGLARAAGAVEPAQAARGREAARPRARFRHGERRPLGADAPRDREDGADGGKGAARRACGARACCAATASCSGACSRARPAWLPPWRDLLRVYRRLEARGEIRGGRFVAGFSGEQFALPEAVGLLREIRRRPAIRRNGCRCPAPIRSTSSAF